jgi:DNA invertase Pin-like site-specific DNA recombinase
MNQPKLTAERLARKALVYIRQSKPSQVLHHQESQRRQYGLKDRARELGFQQVDIIDEDLGRTGSGLVERPGFQRLVAEVCSGEVGAVFCIEASRLARNGRDWHHLIELCGMVSAVVIDFDGIYDPNIVNDRLLLGLKGTMSEFELSLLRQRSEGAIHQKARRGELRILLPVGFHWTSNGKIEKDPDQRVQQAIESVFLKMRELGSARQVLLWFVEQEVCLPALPRDPGEPKMIWKVPVSSNIRAILTNPIYAGAYAFGKTETRTKIVNGRARKTTGHPKPQCEWMVLIRDHHPGYISWEEYERNQAMMASNNFMRPGVVPKSGRGGRALLSGLLRCRRCGRMLRVSYIGAAGVVIHYQCVGANHDCGEDRCISFGGLRVDAAVAKQVLDAVAENAIEAALQAAEQMQQRRLELRESITLELEQARYEARLAARRYEAVDPDQRLVAAELEARWNVSLLKTQALETKLREFDDEIHSRSLPNREVLLSLAQDLPAIWNSPTTDMRLKQRLVRILIEEIVVDVDEQNSQIILVIHWSGGRHSEIRVKKNEIGRHRRCTDIEPIAIIRQMAERFRDEQIAATLNRLGLKTGAGNTWNEARVRFAREYHQLPAVNSDQPRTDYVTLREAAQELDVSLTIVRRMIAEKKLPASQVVMCAPWQIPAEALRSATVRAEVEKAKNRIRAPRIQQPDRQESLFSST